MNNEPLQQSSETPTEDPDLPSGIAPSTPQAPEPQSAQTTPGKPSFNKIIILALAVALLAVVVLALFVWHRHGTADKDKTATSKVYKVGVLDGLDVFFGGSVAGFNQKMTKLGYVEGKNITYDVQKPESLTGNQAILQKFVQDKVDLIVAFPTEPSLEAKAAVKGTTIPIISLNASTEGTGLIDSIKHPGHNLTGVRFPGPEDSVKRLEVLHQLAPTATHVLVPYLKDYPNVPAQLAAMQTAAKTLGQTLTPVPLAPADVAAYVAGLSATHPGFDAIVGAAEPFTVTPALNGTLYAYAAQHKLPILGGALMTDDTGPIAFVAPSSPEVGASGASLADKIFKGKQAGALPVLTPTSYLQINLKVAERLGITPDAGLLSTATKVVK
jgi:putative tryptophan/tyrosine transport system substrate-binding protein